MQFLMDMLDFKQLTTARKIWLLSSNHSKTTIMIRQQHLNFNKVSLTKFKTFQTKFKFYIFCNCSLKKFS
jgi:hypothetical protein